MNYKILFIPSLGHPHKFEKEFKTHAEAKAALNTVADYTLLLHDICLMPDASNMGMILRKDHEGDWIEVDEDDEQID